MLNWFIRFFFQIIYSKLSDLLPAEVKSEDDQSLQRPDVDEIEETTEKTRQALEKLTSSKIAAAMPVRCADKIVSITTLTTVICLAVRLNHDLS